MRSDLRRRFEQLRKAAGPLARADETLAVRAFLDGVGDVPGTLEALEGLAPSAMRDELALTCRAWLAEPPGDDA